MDWKNEYSTGIEEIDAQHRQLLSCFNQITDGVSAEDSWSDIHYRIVELRSFAEFHFSFEEALMRLYAYPEAVQHAETHRAFFRRLDELEHVSITKTVEKEIVRFLFDWLTQHIMKSDKDYARHILAGAPIVKSLPV